MLRKINKCIRDLKPKNKKPIRLETIVQVLGSKTRNYRHVACNQHSYARSNHFLKRLSDDILNMILSNEEEFEEGLIKSVIERLYLYTSANKKNKKIIALSEAAGEAEAEKE